MRRDTVKYIALLFCLTLVIPFLSGCNDTDDVQKIFTGKTWKMTYITKKNEHSWYKFTDVSEAIYKSYDPINGTKAFKIAFTGSTEGSFSVASKFGIKSTTSLSKSARYACCVIFCGGSPDFSRFLAAFA